MNAPIVISGAGVINTYTKMLSPSSTTCPAVLKHLERVRACLRLRPDIDALAAAKPHAEEVLEPSIAMFTAFVGINRSADELGVSPQNKWLFPQWDHDASIALYEEQTRSHHTALSHISREELVEQMKSLFLPVVFISSASSKDTSWIERHGAHSTVFELITIADYDVFAALEQRTSKLTLPKHRGTPYDAAKHVLEQRLFHVLREQYPKLDQAMRAQEQKEDGDAEPLHIQITSGTPLTNQFYLGASSGEVYGLAHTVSRYNGKMEWLLRPKQEAIPGLYLSGQDVVSGGIAGAVAGGVLCAIALQPILLLDLFISYVIDMI